MAAKTLNEYREEQYMAVTEFAKFLGITPATYYNIMKGKRSRPSTMRHIAEKLGVKPSEIVEFQHPRPTK